jgi:hypothetical protein
MKKIIQSYKERKAAKLAAKEQAQLSQIRKPDEIQKEYHGLCAELGDKKYKYEVLAIEMKNISDRLYALNQEFHRSVTVTNKVNANKPAETPAAQPPQAPAEQAANVQA